MTQQLKEAGSALSNIAFNLAQQAGRTITSNDCEVFDNARKEWDSAIRSESLAAQQGAQDQEPIGTVRHFYVGGSGEFVAVEWAGKPPDVGTMIYAHPATKAPEQPASKLEAVDWEDAQRIADLPNIDEEIRNLCNDPTNDSAVCLVRSIMQLAQPAKDLSDEEIIDVALDHMDFAHGGMYQTSEYQHYWCDKDAVIAFARKLLATGSK